MLNYYQHLMSFWKIKDNSSIETKIISSIREEPVHLTVHYLTLSYRYLR